MQPYQINVFLETMWGQLWLHGPKVSMCSGLPQRLDHSLPKLPLKIKQAIVTKHLHAISPGCV
eukprot:3395981-Amphidinium_carterae.1